MYTNKKNVLELIALLKEFDIKDIVISAGSRHIPFAVSVEQDNFFNCYAVIDERSAAYFAIGLILKLGKPVVICCTSGTAVANYCPGIAEAYYQNLPLVVVTGDKPVYQLNQNNGQMIPQSRIFQDITKKEVDIPICETATDIWYANRLINEALMELNHHGTGPVHINIQEGAPLDVFDVPKLPTVRKITRYENLYEIDIDLVKNFTKDLLDKNIMISFGQHIPLSDEENVILDEFINYFCPVIIADNISNLKNNKIIYNSNECVRQISTVNKKKYVPDFIISAGCQMVSSGYTSLLSDCDTAWFIDSSGIVRDEYKKLKIIFEMDFFKFAKHVIEIKNTYFPDYKTDMSYLNLWLNLKEQIKSNLSSFSDFYVSQTLIQALPNNCSLHLANSNSVRYGQMTPLDDSISVFCNRGTSGIDGCVSTAAGYAIRNNQLTVLLIGDLTFFYDSNGLWNRHLSPKFRILLNNNSIGELLSSQWKSFRNEKTQSIFGHNHCIAKGIAEAMGVKYLSASSKEEFDTLLPEFLCEDSEEPILFEVLTKLPENEEALDNYKNNNESLDRIIYHKIKSLKK